MDLSALDGLPLNPRRQKWHIIVDEIGPESAAALMERVCQRRAEGVSVQQLADAVGEMTGVQIGRESLDRILKTKPWA